MLPWRGAAGGFQRERERERERETTVKSRGRGSLTEEKEPRITAVRVQKEWKHHLV